MQRLDFRNLQVPSAISQFFVKGVHNARRHEDPEVEIPLDRASIDKSRSVLVDASSKYKGAGLEIMSSSTVFSASDPNNVRDSTTQTVSFVTRQSPCLQIPALAAAL